MIAELLDIYALAFMQRALLAGLMVALIGGLIGVFIVQRGLAFLGDGLAHAAFGGIALAFLLGLGRQWLWVAVPFTLSVSIGIAFVRDKTKLSSDTSIGIFFAFSVALGVLFLGLIRGYSVDVWHVLFGSVLAVGPVDLYVIAGVTLLTVLFMVFLWKRLAYSTFDAELAQTDGLRVGLLDYLLFMLAAVVVVASVKVVGVILVAAYLVIPAAAARLLARALFSMTIISVGISLFSTVFGLSASFFLDVPSGSTIILTQVALFVLAAFFSRR